MKHLTHFRLNSFFLIFILSFFNSASCYSNPYPDFEVITAKVRQSVVHIRNTPKTKAKNNPLENDKIFKKFFDANKLTPRNRDILGSGFFISSDGYILTEYSVIKNAGKVKVSLDNGDALNARVIGYDKTSGIGLLKILNDNYPTIKIGDANKLKAGQWVMAIGSPFGMENIITIGVVSSTGKKSNKFQSTGYIVNNVTINPGNGGGPLINGRAEVVGMNAVILSKTGTFSGLSFAIPINDIMPIVEKLKKGYKRD